MASIQTRDAILEELLQKAKRKPTGWKAAMGVNPLQHSQDYYVFHPNIGLYVIKEFEKNPFVRQGVGSKVSRRIDDDIEDIFVHNKGKFGIVQGDMKKVLHHLERGHKPTELFQAAMDGKDMGIRIPLRGNATSEKPVFSKIHEAMGEKRKKLDAAYDELITEEQVNASYS